MRLKRWPAALTVCAVTAMLTITPVMAQADDSGTTQSVDVLQNTTETASSDDNLAQAVLDQLPDSDDIVTAEDGSLTLQVGGLETTLPSNTGEPVVIGDVEVSVPGADTATQGERINAAAVEFDNRDGSMTVPVMKDDGSVQVTSILADTSAPTSYDYDLHLPEGATISVGETGVVTATAGERFIMGVAPAWAVDADGKTVPTHYEVRGSTLTQIVDHHSGEFAYPIVADPWMGVRLFSRIWVAGSQHISMTTSTWGKVIQATGGGAGWLHGQMILNGAGWAEATSAIRMLTTKATYYQQYQCHVLGAYTPLTGGPSWDLEGWRANRPWWRTDGGAFPYKCNWP